MPPALPRGALLTDPRSASCAHPGRVAPGQTVAGGAIPGQRAVLPRGWTALRDDPRGARLFFDFDGTLAAIAADPARVRPVAGAIAALTRLNELVGRVAIVSARPVRFLHDQFGGLVDLYGLYGLESFRDGRRHTHPEAERWRPVIADVAARAAEMMPPAQVEAKGLSVALHYRTTPGLADRITSWGRGRANELGLRCQPGRMVMELKPPIAYDKGDVVRAALGDASAAWFCGDDVADLRAFQALDERSAADPSFAALRVAVANPETGAELTDAADLTVSSPPALISLLDDLAADLRRR
ncbi:trehalose-phosphatase [Pilimelia columellifera]|uniref:Trehalose 6-phosphate phosphatase n=1 Tax=Pilimelia columellifera subsp. columellifera TaxID=706583 RepID=A0ABP6AD27_9ACTN